MARQHQIKYAGVAIVAVLFLVGGCSRDDDASQNATTSSPPSTPAPPSTPPSTSLPTSVDTTAPMPTTTTMPPAEASVDADDVKEHEEISYSFGAATINGVKYANALIMRPDSYRDAASRLEIDAGRSRKRFLGDLGIPDSERSATAYKIEISLDNAAPVFSTEIRFGETRKIDIDVTNVLRIKIVASPITCCDAVAIGSPRFGR
jgi:hypothetical protein